MLGLCPALLSAVSLILGAALSRPAYVQSPKWAQMVLSQRLPVFSVEASPTGVKLLKHRFCLHFVKYSGTRQRVECFMVFRRKQTYFLFHFVFLKQLSFSQLHYKIAPSKLPEWVQLL